MIIARAGRFIEDQLTATKAIENARKLRANQRRKFVQKEDVIRMRECRRIIFERKDEEDRLKTKREMRAIVQQRKR